ncbi:MAG: methylmalonyl Co-A mutase-associated GTPase MeaB [Bacteroidales bacterium]|nr:methylmalonyl Co-A mutase-associated GTPase MeaB [Bacteroidales bacterium]
MNERDKKTYSNFEYDSALNVQGGVKQPEQVSNFYLEKMQQKKRNEPSVEQLVDGILHGDRVMLSRAITLVESSRFDHQRKAQQIIEQCLPHSGKSIRLGITGVPGAGKSTTIEALGKMLTALGHKIAVLAIDPSSERSKGSILGDKTRMKELSTDPNAFIRPSPSAGSLGGVARKTREIILLCEAAGFDVVIVETVGVGQSEVAAHSMVDFFLLLQLANTGDELQGIKRGIMEMADMIAINKSDIDIDKSKLAAQQFRNALHLFPLPESQWTVPVMLCSAYSKMGLQEIWNKVTEYVAFTKGNGYFYHKRQQQNLRILDETIENTLKERFYSAPGMEEKLEKVRQDILDSKVSAYTAAEKLIEEQYKSRQ